MNSFSVPVATIIISNLPHECKEPDLLILAQSYGRVKSCEIKRDFRNHVVSVFGILTYFELQGAETALHCLQGANCFGHILRVDWASRSAGSAAARVPQPSNSSLRNQYQKATNRTAQVHFSYLSKQLDFIVTERFLREVFGRFGPVLEVALKKTSVDPEMAVQNGYGFIHFPLTKEGIESALTAVQSMHRVTMREVTFDCSVSNQLKQVLLSLERNAEAAVYQRHPPVLDQSHPSYHPQHFVHSKARRQYQSRDSSGENLLYRCDYNHNNRETVAPPAIFSPLRPGGDLRAASYSSEDSGSPVLFLSEASDEESPEAVYYSLWSSSLLF